MIDLRGGILAVTICLLIALAANRPHPVQSVEVPHCVISYKSVATHPITGETVTGWARGFGPCSLQDIYRNN